jgi:hypothetical protein
MNNLGFSPHTGGYSLKQIVILQRGWVVVGDFAQSGSQCSIKNGHVVRRWGTTKGLGELATEGPRTNTVLDPIPEMTFHELTIVGRLACSDKWSSQP